MNKQKTLCAGFGRVDITPDFPVGLDGYHNEETRRSEGVRDPLYLACVAVSQGEDTLLIFEADLVSISDWLADQIRDKVCAATEIPRDKVFCGATHTHSGPAYYTDTEEAARYLSLLTDRAVLAAKAALADLAPAKLLTATKIVEGMNFNRHYLMEDGSYAGSNFGNNSLRYVAHISESDPRMLLAQFVREDKPSIVMMNWQAHNDNVGQVGARMLSASYTGRVRAKFEEETGMHFALVMGAAGDENPNSCIPEERHSLGYVEYGEKLAQYAMELLKDMKPVNGEDIVTKRVYFEATVNHDWDPMLDKANEVYDVWKNVGFKEGSALAKTYGFSSVYQTKHIRSRAELGETISVCLNAFRIGDLAFVTVPNDTFAYVGLHVRLHAPFDSTFFITGNAKYMATMAAYDYRSYEGDSSPYVKGTTEKIADTLVDMLKSIR